MKKLDFTQPGIEELLIKTPQEDNQVDLNSLDYQG